MPAATREYKDVVAFAAIQDVVAGTAIQHVISGTALQGVCTGIAVQLVVAVQSLDQIIECGAVQILIAGVAGQLHLQQIRLHPARPIGKHHLLDLIACAEEVLQCYRVAVGMLEHQIIQAARHADILDRHTGAEDNPIDIRRDIACRTVIDDVGAPAEVEAVGIAAAATDQHIMTGSADQRIVAIVPVQPVVPAAGIEQVGERSAMHRLGCRCPNLLSLVEIGQCPDAAITELHFIDLAILSHRIDEEPTHRHPVRRALVPEHQVMPGTGYLHVFRAYTANEHDTIRIQSIGMHVQVEDDILPPSGREHVGVVAGPTVKGIVATAAFQEVIAGAAVQDVIAIQAKQIVIRKASSQRVRKATAAMLEQGQLAHLRGFQHAAISEAQTRQGPAIERILDEDAVRAADHIDSQPVVLPHEGKFGAPQSHAQLEHIQPLRAGSADGVCPVSTRKDIGIGARPA